MIELNIYANGDSLSGSEQLTPLLKLLETSSFPPLDFIRRTDMKDVKVKSYLDAPVIKFLDKKKYAINFIDTSGKEVALIMQMPSDETIIGINYLNTDNIKIVDIMRFFKSAVNATSPYIAKVRLEPDTGNFVESQYMEKERTFRSPGLIWLQYYAGAELERQGGIEAIEKNPYAKTEQFHEGIIVQVGESPFDIQTIPGRALLVNATKAMPPSHWR